MGLIGAWYVFTQIKQTKIGQAFGGARDQLPIRLYRGRSNYRGTLNSQKGGYKISGNKNQRNLQNQSIKIMKRSNKSRSSLRSGMSYYSRNGIPVNPQEQRTINEILTRQRRERGWS